MPKQFLVSPYSPRTWEAASVGLKNRQTAFGTSSFHAVKRIVKPGDVFLCYVIGELQFVGALEATSEAYVDHSSDVLGLLLYPVRVDTNVIARKDIGEGVHLHDIKARTDQPESWNGILRGGLKRIPTADAKWIVKQLSK